MTDGIIKTKPRKDLTGMTFGKLTVLEQGPDLIHSGQRRTSWHCKCSCGNPEILLISGDSLKSNHTKSCGCIKKETCARNNTYDLSGEYGRCIMNDGSEFIFDKDDYNLIRQYVWHLTTNGYIITSIYDKATKSSYGMLLHRYLMGVENISWKEFVVDHINGNIRDNRRDNLRVITQSQNGMNSRTPKNNSSGCVGVSKQNNKWVAHIKVNWEDIYLGIYERYEDVVVARKEAEEKLFGEYSYSNSRKMDGDVVSGNSD